MVKMSILPNLTYIFNTFPTKSQQPFMLISIIFKNLCGKHRYQNSLKNFEKNNIGGFISTNFKISIKQRQYSQCVITKNMTHKSINQNRKPMNNPSKYSQLIFDKMQRRFNGKRIVFSINYAKTTKCKCIWLSSERQLWSNTNVVVAVKVMFGCGQASSNQVEDLKKK